MPEAPQGVEKYPVPRFVLPPELTNPKVEAPAEPPKEAKEVKPPVTEAVTPEPETTEVKADEPEKQEKDASRRFERRIDRLHRRAAEAQARAELLEKELTELRTKSSPSPSTAPRMEDYTDVQEYAKAYAKHEKEQALKEFQQKQRDDATQSEQKQLLSEWEAKVSKAAQKYDDFDEVVGEVKPTTPWAFAMMTEDNGPDIAHYLGNHPAEVRKIAALKAVDQVKAIARLGDKLAAPQEKPKKPSTAPAPIEPVKGEAKVNNMEITPNQSPEEYRKIRNKLLGRK